MFCCKIIKLKEEAELENGIEMKRVAVIRPTQQQRSSMLKEASNDSSSTMAAGGDRQSRLSVFNDDESGSMASTGSKSRSPSSTGGRVSRKKERRNQQMIENPAMLHYKLDYNFTTHKACVCH